MQSEIWSGQINAREYSRSLFGFVMMETDNNDPPMKPKYLQNYLHVKRKNKVINKVKPVKFEGELKKVLLFS